LDEEEKMIQPLDLLLLLFLVVCAMVAVRLKDLLDSVIVLAAYSLFMAVTWVEMNAPDVAFTEAAVGAGITTFLFIAALVKTVRREGT
jgi:energy-converting hydrogenase B subunit D